VEFPTNRCLGGGNIDAARIGHLVASGGMWAGADGETPVRMMSEKFAAGFITPSYPQNNAAYGWLTWLNTDVEAITPGLHCCGPRWGHAGFVCQGGSRGAGGKDCAQCCRARDRALPSGSTYMCNLSSTNLNENNADKHIEPGEPRAEWMDRVGSSYRLRVIILTIRNSGSAEILPAF
jgi:hypothetical protein